MGNELLKGKGCLHVAVIVLTLIVLCLAGSVYARCLGTDAAYFLDTSKVLAGPYDPTQFTSLDGTWAHYASDRWDGSGIGEGSPGGVSTIDGYLRIQDTGDPRDYGVPDATSNCKIYLVHNMGPDGASATVLDDGVTLFFRTRLATGGLLDQLSPNGGGDLADVPATGDGYVIHDSGKGNIGIKQAARGIISFSLTTAEENNGVGGLIMNSLNGTALSGSVDSGEGTANVIPLDPTVWHDFWVTIQKDTSGVGTHQVNVYVDGGPAQTFVVTAGNANDFDGISFIALGVGSTNISGAFDIAAFQFAPGIVVTGVSYPANGASDVGRDGVLSWTSSESGSACNVYLGTDVDEIRNAAAGSQLLVGPGVDVNTFDPGRLEYGWTYYWRVDKIGAKVLKGNVWSFTVEPFAREITADSIIATASSQSPDMGGPEKTVDGSGLNALDQHDTTDADMWTSDAGQEPPVWIKYEFDTVYKLHQMWVWNSNNALEFLAGWGVRTATIEYSTDDTTWDALANVPEFAQAPGTDDYDDYTPVDFGGVAAKFVRMTFTSSWGGGSQYGLSEVRFLTIPLQARDPNPATGATGVPINTTLSWKAGRGAASHEIHLGTDMQAVTDSTTPVATVSQAKYSPLNLQLDTTYYWKVVEVNQVESPSAWDSKVWSFSTSQYLVVDDFESYSDDSPHRVFQTWLDGGGFSADEFFPIKYEGNGTGSLVGYDPESGHIMEYKIVRPGSKQSMPMTYNGLSETTRTFEPAQDWTQSGITTLVIHFYGTAGNTGQLYVKIGNTKIPYPGAGTDIAAESWIPWEIDLASSGASLTNVSKLSIGIDGSGASGLLYINDILLK